jgi:hypothetical protein
MNAQARGGSPGFCITIDVTVYSVEDPDAAGLWLARPEHAAAAVAAKAIKQTPNRAAMPSLPRSYGR